MKHNKKRQKEAIPTPAVESRYNLFMTDDTRD